MPIYSEYLFKSEERTRRENSTIVAVPKEACCGLFDVPPEGICNKQLGLKTELLS